MAELNGNFNAVNSSDHVHDWETGLPNVDDITPLSYGLLSPELLSAFNIKPEPYRTAGDVTQASEKTLSALRGGGCTSAATAVEDDGDVDDTRRNVSPEDADSAAAEEAEAEDDGEEKAAKRARLVWTPQLHRRFVEVVAHLGIKNAVPKTIMQLMNVEGLTRENVASHLQKYRLYLKRNQGFSFETVPSAPAPFPAPAQLPVSMQNNHFNYNYSQNNNSNNNNNSQFNNGVMQTGNNMYGSVGVSYHQNHLNHHRNMQK